MNRRSFSVSLSDELELFVQSLVASGRYEDASDVIQEQLVDAALDEVRVKVRRGSEQADRGEVLDSEAVFAELAARCECRRAERLP